MRSIRIGIVEDDGLQTASLIRAIDADKRFVIVFFIQEIRQAMEHIRKTQPDILILNYEKRGASAVSLLKKMSTLSSSEKPYIMITSHLQGRLMLGYLAEQGVNDLIVKPFNNGEILAKLSYLYSFLNDCYSDRFISRIGRKLLGGYSACEHNRINRGREEVQILTGVTYDLLVESQIPVGNQGFCYFIEAVRFLYYTENLETVAMKELYICVGERYNTSAANVERSLRKVVNIGWNRRIEAQKRDDLFNIFAKYVTKPVNKEILIYTTLYVKKILKNEFYAG